MDLLEDLGIEGTEELEDRLNRCHWFNGQVAIKISIAFGTMDYLGLLVCLAMGRILGFRHAKIEKFLAKL